MLHFVSALPDCVSVLTCTWCVCGTNGRVSIHTADSRFLQRDLSTALWRRRVAGITHDVVVAHHRALHTWRHRRLAAWRLASRRHRQVTILYTATAAAVNVCKVLQQLWWDLRAVKLEFHGSSFLVASSWRPREDVTRMLRVWNREKFRPY